MSDKSRAYSDSSVTIIFKGDGWSDVKRHIDDATALAQLVAELRAENERLSTELASYRRDANKI